jgi:ABC-type transport system involved in cytochrome c biogenesis permease component
MRSLPIAHRELIVAGRQRWTYHTRVLAAVLLTALSVVLLGFSGGGSIPQGTFKIVSSTVFAACLLGGMFLSADSIVAERRNGTLGLLFLTPLGGFDVSTGKLVACGIRGLCALLGILPILAVPLMMGGISGTTFWTTSVGLLATFACSSAIGLWASARSDSAPAAYSLALLLLLAFCALPPFLGWMMRESALFPPDVPLHVELLSPIGSLAYGWMADSVATSGRNRALFSAAISLSLATLLTLLAARQLQRNGRKDRPAEPRTKPGAMTGAALPRAKHPATKNVLINPFARQYAQRISRTRALEWIQTLGLIAFAGFQLAAFTLPDRTAIPMFITAMLVAYGLHVVFKIRTALAAGAPWFEEIQQGGLELLLSTPLNLYSLREGHGQAVRHHVSRHRWILTAVNLVLCLNLLDQNLDINDATIRTVFLSLFLGGLLSLWVDLPTLIHGAFLHSLRQRKLGSVLTRTLLPVILPPWCSALALFICGTNGINDGEMSVLFVTFTLIQIVVSFGAATKASLTLKRDLRTLASQRIESAPTTVR